MKLEWGLPTNIDEVENLLHSGFRQASLWCSMEIINANISWSFNDHSSTAIELKETVSCMGLLTGRGSSRYDKQSRCWWFETWWCSYDATVMKWIISLCHAYDIFVLNQITPITLESRYMNAITSQITGDTTVCSCDHAAWQQRIS